MGVDEFERWWRERERADIVRMMASVHHADCDDSREVCLVAACAELDVVLRRSGRRLAGSRAAHRVRRAVLDACERTGLLDEDRDGVVRLARAAGDAGRALVCEPAPPCIGELLAPFRSELPLAS